MSRNKFIFIGLAVVVTICIVAGIFLTSRGNVVSIQNNTAVTITGLKIKYSNSPNETKVPEILPKQIYKTKLILPKNFSEGSIIIFYTDKRGENHEEYLFGYIEKGNKLKVDVTIDSVDNNGVLAIKIY